MNIDFEKQANFFDEEEHRFSVSKIQNPPLHCISEIQTIINLLPKTQKSKWKILDYGAGSGRLSIPLLQEGYNVTAFDISNKSLMSLQRIARELVAGGTLKTINKLTGSSTYDFIVGTDILHHIDLETDAQTIYRHLEPKGRIIFSEPCGNNIFWYVYLPLTAPWEIERGVMQIKKNTLRQTLIKAKFKQISIRGFGFLPRPLFNFSKRISRANDRFGGVRFFDNFAYRYLISASK